MRFCEWKPNNKNIVLQEDKTGCAFATLVQVSYQDVKQIAYGMGIAPQDSKLWSQTSYVRQLLQYFHIQASKQELPFQECQRLP